jgi:UDP-N-acetylglucosamine:LPS N-acetylglucosamine transferase
VLDPARSHGRDVWTALLDADVVVCHGGQNAVAEVAAARRPAVVIAQPRPYQEQAATAAALDRLGIATGLHRWPEGSDWPGLLERALERGGSGWKAWSTGHAARDVAAFLEKL